MRVTVIGGGPAGIMAAITAAQNGHKVTLMEKNDRLGKKLFITGGGRCNICYDADPEELIKNTKSNPNFLYSAFYAFGSSDLINFFESRGLKLKSENGRIFPKSDRSIDVIKVLENTLEKLGVNVLLNHTVDDIEPLLKKSAVIIATGGLSYPATGSTGDGYAWAKDLGHKVTKLRPALVPLLANIKDLAGISLKAGLKLASFQGVGELLFTHKGISGPITLEASRYWREGATAYVDFMPDIDTKQLDKLILKSFEENSNKSIANIFEKMFPKRLCSAILDFADKKANAVTKAERASIINNIKNWPIKITGTAFKEAIITTGGVNVREINPSDMSSKIIPNLYFAGEIIDVDAATGGFNLQIAFSTGYLAGSSIGE